jgi:hypothetical protein
MRQRAASAMAAELTVADQYQHEYDNHCSGDQAYDDHRGIAQADQVQPGCARFCERLLLAPGLAASARSRPHEQAPSG